MQFEEKLRCVRLAVYVQEHSRGFPNGGHTFMEEHLNSIFDTEQTMSNIHIVNYSFECYVTLYKFVVTNFWNIRSA